MIAEKNIKLFEKYNVLSEREVHSRYDIYLERYCKDINIESLQALDHRQDDDPAGGLSLSGRVGLDRAPI